MDREFTEDYVMQQIMRMYLNSNEKKKKSKDDAAFRDDVTKEITNRDELYTKLLKHFEKVTAIRNYLKEFFKWTFYLAVILAVVVFAVLVFKIFDRLIKDATIAELIEAIPLFITSIVGFVSIVIAIPLAITRYLFSTEEDKYITDIIQHTQQHDTDGRKWALDFKKIADELKGKNTEQHSEEKASWV